MTGAQPQSVTPLHEGEPISFGAPICIQQLFIKIGARAV
jgi:hypothetical protein